jgi:3-oxoacyl-[acyl-carrier-protein] synthase-1
VRAKVGRVVVTGMGVVSPIGNSTEEVHRSLRGSISGIEFDPEMREMGLRCQVAGRIKNLNTSKIGKRPLQTMSAGGRFAAVAAWEAVEDAKLTGDALKSRRAGVVVGSGGGGMNETLKVENHFLEGGAPARLGATGPVKIMNSSAALNLAAWFGIKGRCYSVSSGCATGTDNIGHAFELVRHDLLDVCLCGGTEEICMMVAAFLDNLAFVPFDFNDRPGQACRPYDRDRQGLVLSEGAGILVLESLEHAVSRGAQMYAEVIAYGSANGGTDVFEPGGANGKGLRNAIEQALDAANFCSQSEIDYIHPHGAGTRTTDPIEIQVLRELLGAHRPPVSSTKSLSGYTQGAAGAHEAILTLLMLHHGFIAPTVNLEHIDPDCEGVHHVQSLMDSPVRTAMTISSGLGGSNACLIFRRL